MSNSRARELPDLDLARVFEAFESLHDDQDNQVLGQICPVCFLSIKQCVCEVED